MKAKPVFVTDGMWTEGSDNFVAEKGGVIVRGNSDNTPVNMRAGNDSIYGKFPAYQDTGVIFEGLLTLSKFGGSLSITGIGNLDAPEDSLIKGEYKDCGIMIQHREVTLESDSGDDSISGQASTIGIQNSGRIKLGDGNDTIYGSSRKLSSSAITGDRQFSWGIINRGDIESGYGNDTITGIGGQIGITTRGRIRMGEGNDIITGTGGKEGIQNFGEIELGDGNDTLIGTGAISGIQNSGTIDFGDGNNTLAALTPAGILGIFGIFDFEQNSGETGKVVFGNGQDLVRGFGKGSFIGGDGKDTLELPSGSYTAGSTNVSIDYFITLSSGDKIMNLKDFEVLNIAGKTFDFANLTPGTIVSG